MNLSLLHVHVDRLRQAACSKKVGAILNLSIASGYPSSGR
jgi:hypothetical protein